MTYITSFLVISVQAVKANPLAVLFWKGVGMKKKPRADHVGRERGIFTHNKTILRNTATVCALCGMPLDKTIKYPDPMSISIDHIIPLSLGGKSTIDNLQAAHLICNKQKGNRLFNVDKDKKDFEMKQTLTIPQYVDWSSV